MIQDIEPHHFNNQFLPKEQKDRDYLFIFNRDGILMDTSFNQFEFTTIAKIKELNPKITDNLIYLFEIDGLSVFYTPDSIEETETLKYIKLFNLRETLPNLVVFIAATANHLAKWYSSNKFCGSCAEPMEHSKTERSLYCKKCGLIKYPNINPAVIVGIIDKDKILLTKYSDRPYKKFSLVAGFVEVGEALESTIKREVMEEVGLKVKNIKYFKNQPWAFSQSLLVGFFVDLEGSPNVKIDKTELAEATWFKREEVPECESTLSLTNEMIEAFRKNKIDDLLQLR